MPFCSLKIELKKLSNSRTAKQNRALHKFFVIVSEQLNEMGLEFTYSGLNVHNLCTRYTPSIVKDFFWRPIQIALFEVEELMIDKSPSKFTSPLLPRYTYLTWPKLPVFSIVVVPDTFTVPLFEI